MARQIDVGSILGETVALVRENAREALIFTAVVGGLSAIGVLTGLTPSSAEAFSVAFGASVEIGPESSALASLLDLAVTVATIVGLYWLVKAYLASRNRLVSNENRFWPYLGMAILSGIAIVVGFIFLIVPGIILVVRWSAANGFLVSGREGVIDSLKASWEATRGNAMTIFLAGLVMIIVLILVAGTVSAVFGFVNLTLGGAIGAIVEAAFNTLLAAFGVAVYLLLESDGEQLEEVFS